LLEFGLAAPGEPGPVHLPPGGEKERVPPGFRFLGPFFYRRVLLAVGDVFDRHAFAEAHGDQRDRAARVGRFDLELVPGGPPLALVEDRDLAAGMALEAV